ncbi:MAG: Spy/CpxP family protein refolding chaperone [Hydrogenophaga sp.]
MGVLPSNGLIQINALGDTVLQTERSQHWRRTMITRQTLLVAGLALVLSACSYPGSMGRGSGPGTMGGGPAMMGSSPSGGMLGGGYGMGMGMGMGMMGSPGAMGWGLELLDLSADQRARIAAIHDELQQRHWTSMQAMHAESGPMSAWTDEAAQHQRFGQMSALHKQVFDAHLEARRRILEVLTPVQRQQLTTGKPGS